MTDTAGDTQGSPEVRAIGTAVAGAEADTEGRPLTQQINRLVETYVRSLTRQGLSHTPIHVDEIASKIAKFYELLRKVVDWKDDNLLRRTATERILKRLLVSKVSGISLVGEVDSAQVAESVVTELIRGGHLPNDEIPKEKVIRVQEALDTCLYFLSHAPINTNAPLGIKAKINFFTFMLEVTACQIEEILTEPVLEDGLVMAMAQIMYERINVTPQGAIEDIVKRTQVYIATCRTLYDLDDAYISYHLLKFRYPKWMQPDEEFRKTMAPQILSVWQGLEAELAHPLSKDFYAICERVDTAFTLMGDILAAKKSEPMAIRQMFRNPELLNEALTAAYNKRYVSMKKRLFRLAIFSTLSVFVSNWFSFFIVEVPLAHVFYEGFSLFTALVDFSIPTIAMFVLVAIIRPPGKANMKKAIDLTMSFVYADRKRELYEIRTNKRARPVLRLFLTLIYTAATLGAFAGVAYVFYVAGLPITSVIFDTFTIALTVFAAVLIRNKARELSVDDKTSVWEFFLDMLAVPVAKIGSVLAAKWKEYNIVAVFFTFFIETPFVFFLDLLEQWSQFLKERKAELH